MTTKANQEYRSRIYLTNQTICSVTGTDQKTVMETVQNLFLNQAVLSIAMRGKPLRFEDSDDGNSVFIFHESFQTGQQPVGWITAYQVPEALSVRHLAEQRLSAQKAA